MTDPLIRLARERVLARRVADSADLEVQFSSRPGHRPVVAMLRKAMHGAAEAMTGLVLVDAEKPAEIRELQNRVRLFDELVTLAREVITEGESADEELTQAERDELLDYLTQSDEGRAEAEELGLIDREVNDA